MGKKKQLNPVVVQKIRISNGNPNDIQYHDVENLKLKDPKSLPILKSLINKLLGGNKNIDLMYRTKEVE